jgi:hypothetical protein
VNRLELVVNEGRLDQRRQAPVMEEALQLAERLEHLVRRRRDIGRVRRGTAGGADPVLDATKLPRRGLPAANGFHEPRVQLANQTQRERQALQTLDAVLQRRDVVGHLLEVRRARLDIRAGLRHEQLFQRRLRPFDAAREDRLPADEGADQKARLREPAAFSGQAADGAVGVR